MNKKLIQQKSRRKNGFTLIELLFACAILGFMLTITLVTFIGVFRFYIWAKTTRTTQESSRQLLNTITREIQARNVHSVNGSSICLNNPNPGFSEKSFSIFLNSTAHSVQTQSFSDLNCGTAAGSVTTISAQSVAISGLNFTQVNGPPNANPNLHASSVVVQLQTTNGTPAADGKCVPADNFCDQAEFTTAVMER